MKSKVRSDEPLSFRGTPADWIIGGGLWREESERANFEACRSDTASSFRNLENVELCEMRTKSALHSFASIFTLRYTP